MKPIIIFTLLCLMTSCTGDLIPPNVELPDHHLLLDKRWNLKTSVKGGTSTSYQGKWIRYSKVSTPSYDGFMYEDSDSVYIKVSICGVEIFSDFDAHKIEYLKKDSLVLFGRFNSTTYHFSTKN